MDSIEYYNKYAAKVYEDTVNQNMSEIMSVFLAELEKGDTILDLGCGSGRDSLILHDMGYDVTPLDASAEMCKLAEIHTGLDVLQMRYEEMEFDEVFDGIWGCAALVHTPKQQMLPILDKLCRSLKHQGVLYMSFKLGDFEGFRGERYYCDYNKKSMEVLVEEAAHFQVIKIWSSQDVRSSHPNTEWLNVLLRKN